MNIKRFIAEHHRMALGITSALAVCVAMIGCSVTVPNPFNPSQKVNAAQLTQMAVNEKAADTVLLAGNHKLTAAAVAKIQERATEIAAAQKEMAAKQAQRAQVIQSLGGIATIAAGTGFSIPSAVGAITQILLLLGGAGAAADSFAKSRTITALKVGGVASNTGVKI